MECIADLHLQASEPATLAAWQRYLKSSPASAILILGDLFESWVGDDALQEAGSFEAQCAATLHAASQQRPIYFMVGNRDFLAGTAFLPASGMQGLADPTLLVWGPQRILLSHGDALCLDDAEVPTNFAPWAASPPGNTSCWPAPGRAPRPGPASAQRKRSSASNRAWSTPMPIRRLPINGSRTPRRTP